jgi:maleate cis-trans isomerase
VTTIHVLKQELSRPVLTANQVAFWHALRVSKKGITVTGYRRRRFEARAHIGSSITFD